MASTCPTKVELEELLKGTLPPVNSAALDQHLLQCAACRQQLNALAGGNESWLKARQTPPVDSLDSPPLRERQPGLPFVIQVQWLLPTSAPTGGGWSRLPRMEPPAFGTQPMANLSANR